MKTISLRELHNNTGKWMRAAQVLEEIIVTDRGVAIAKVQPLPSPPRKVYSWADRPLTPGFADYLREGKVGPDSTPAISADRALRDVS